MSAPLIISKSLTLDANGHRVTLDGNQNNRLLVIATNVAVQLKGLACIRGRGEFGGAIWNQGGQLTLENCRLDLNETVGTTDGTLISRGGAIFSNGGSLSVFASSFSSNTCAGALTDGSGYDAFGGAIAVEATSLRLEHTRLLNNLCLGGRVAGFWTSVGSACGGALSITNADATLIACDFISNSVKYPYLEDNAVQAARAGQGGAIIHLGNGQLNLAATTFERNTAIGPSGGRNGANGPGQGGAIFAQVPVVADQCRFARNYVGGGGGGLGQASDASGGALYLTQPSRLQSCFLEANDAEAGTGCLCGLQGAASNGMGRGGAVFAVASLDILDSSFYSNRVHILNGFNFGPGPVPVPNANMGGALYVTSGARIVNSTFLRNQAIAQLAATSSMRLEGPTGAAAIFADGGLLTLTSSTFATNFTLLATNLSIPAITLSTPGTGRLAGVLLSGNLPGNISGSFEDLGGNLSSDASTGFTNPASLTALGAKLGRPTRTVNGFVIPPLAGSPALDAASADLTPDTDELGHPRPIGARSDIGAIELQYPPTISLSTNGSIAGAFTVGAHQTHNLQFTSDFITWESLRSLSSDSSGRLAFEDQRDPKVTGRFYRTQRVFSEGP
ncbi:MAG: hypothetical protein IT581_06875 [Verrucomicrobiales bacterium]|nr:hypothetical protein [Verrucomicrobiales bacterium]